MKWKIAAIASSCAFIALIVGIFAYGYFTETYGLRKLDTNTIVTQVQRLSQLITVKYRIQRVVGLREPKVPFGEESILLMVEGEALAGVDLTTMRSRDVHYTSAHEVTITIPAAKLFNVFLDEKQSKVWDRQITWWTPWVPYDPELEHKARLQALDNVRKAALNMGILNQAQKNAEVSIRDLLGVLGLKATLKTRSLD
jgi:hypothetical protein